MYKTPPLRVSRPVSACARCRNAKIRCDGKLPACTACEKVGKASECTSGNDQFARGKERSFVASLETRIERLQHQLHYYPQVDQPVISVKQVSTGTEVAGGVAGSRKDEASDVDELVSGFGNLAVYATSNGYHGFDREMSLARLLLSTATINPITCPSNYTLPSRPIAIGLLQSCVNGYLILCPIVSFTTALGALERAYYYSGHLASFEDLWTVRLMLAMGLLARSREKGDEQQTSAAHHVAIALETAGTAIITPGSLSRLRCLLLLVLYSTANPTHLDPWYLMGMAARFTVEMGLHFNACNLDGINPLQADDRRALFCLVYELDRRISMSRLKPFSFSDESVDLTPPSNLTPKDLLQQINCSPEKTFNEIYEDFALSFVLLHQDQSTWYYDLYYSGHEASSESWTTRLNAITENHSWLSKIPSSASGSFRSRFRLQVFYFGVLLILPLEKSLSKVSVYGQALALEYLAEYALAIAEIVESSDITEVAQSDDWLRTVRVSNQLLKHVKDSEVASVQDLDLTEPKSNFSLPLLSWTKLDLNERLEQIRHVLHKMNNALAYLNKKYGDGEVSREWCVEYEAITRNMAVQTP